MNNLMCVWMSSRSTSAFVFCVLAVVFAIGVAGCGSDIERDPITVIVLDDGQDRPRQQPTNNSSPNTPTDGDSPSHDPSNNTPVVDDPVVTDPSNNTPTPDPGDNTDNNSPSEPTDENNGNNDDPTVDEPSPSQPAAPGKECNCDSDCAGTAQNSGVCINGICMQVASQQCSSAGSQSECGAGLRCWENLCYPDCDAFECDGGCDSDGSCIFTAATACDSSCSAVCTDSSDNGGNNDTSGCPPNSTYRDEGCYCNDGYVVNEDLTACVRECTDDSGCGAGMVCIDHKCAVPPCTPGSCGAGMVCAADGNCVIDVGTIPPGPVPDCTGLIDWQCHGGESHCGEVVLFEPVLGPGYWNYPINGETENNLYRSYARRDMIQLIKYAAAHTECLSQNWTFGNQQPLGLGDMSEADGAIPGTSVGYPGHPAGTHVNGYDMDIAYFQVNTPDNKLRSVCDHIVNGQDQYRCVGEPHLLDVWRTALFLGLLHDTPQLRIIGLDGKVGPMVVSATTQLCANGWLNGSVCAQQKYAYETTNQGLGWYHFHHHHFHVSLRTRAAAGLTTLVQGEFDNRRLDLMCLTRDCTIPHVKGDPRSLMGCQHHAH